MSPSLNPSLFMPPACHHTADFSICYSLAFFIDLPDICEYLILPIVELMQVEVHDVNYLKDHLFEPNSIISFIFIGIKNVIICHDLFIYLSMDIWTFCHYKQACYEHSCTYILVYIYSLSFRIHTREWNFWNI